MRWYCLWPAPERSPHELEQAKTNRQKQITDDDNKTRPAIFICFGGGISRLWLCPGTTHRTRRASRDNPPSPQSEHRLCADRRLEQQDQPYHLVSWWPSDWRTQRLRDLVW